jgi:1-acyl-sn-glycerol-3-phosphate acyltransferase
VFRARLAVGGFPHVSTSAAIARAGLRAVGGWRYVGPVPQCGKAVCLAVPHTSNFDGLLLVLLAQSVDLPISWMVKASWARPPIGWAIRGVGGIPIDRSRAHGMVEQMIEAFARSDALYLVIPPEGTRSRAEAWKSGFYHIALGAGVPLLPGFLDYRSKEGGFGDPIELSGNVREDMDVVRAFYRDGAAMARYPDKFGPVRLREEDDARAIRSSARGGSRR